MNKNVLVVDNDKDSTRVVLEILAHRNIRARVVGYGKNVAEFFEKSSYDLVFSVIRVSKPYDDFRLIREIKAAFPQLPVITICDTENHQQNNQHLLDVVMNA